MSKTIKLLKIQTGSAKDRDDKLINVCFFINFEKITSVRVTEFQIVIYCGTDVVKLPVDKHPTLVDYLMNGDQTDTNFLSKDLSEPESPSARPEPKPESPLIEYMSLDSLVQPEGDETLYVRVHGEGFAEHGITDGDIMVCNFNKKPTDNDVVFVKSGTSFKLWLFSESAKQRIFIDGVVTHVTKSLTKDKDKK